MFAMQSLIFEQSTMIVDCEIISVTLGKFRISTCELVKCICEMQLFLIHSVDHTHMCSVVVAAPTDMTPTHVQLVMHMSTCCTISTCHGHSVDRCRIPIVDTPVWQSTAIGHSFVVDTTNQRIVSSIRRRRING